MTRIGVRTAMVLAAALVVGSAGPAAAANKEHQQLMAEIRMLQEQTLQLHQMIGALGESLKTVSAKLEDQSNASRKGFADQRLLIEGVGETARILREKADDTNVRLSSMTHELESIRQGIQTIASQPSQTLTPPAQPPGVAGDPAVQVPPAVTTAPPPSVPPGVAPTRLYDTAFADYTSGQYELAIQGFEAYIRTFPRSPQAADAQFNIGNSYYNAGKYKEAVAAYQQTIADYAQSPVASSAYYKMGLSYEQLKQPDLARKAWETLIQKYPSALPDITLARQGLERINRKD
jgi:tol-pal system protein YbgF